MTTTAVFAALTTIVGTIWGVFSDVASTITGNPLLLVPVLFAFGGGIVIFCIGIVRRLGVRGLSSGGKRRRGR